ncbi:MAG: NAD(P)-dependent oxidoreductase [Planctomycetota bacterium]|nr:NAD(P)-dependent oxidoreductase [Planctomycetota bacterium]
MSKARVAFLGLGIMGSGMARRLLAAGFPVIAYNRNPDKSAAIAKEGAKSAQSPREAAAQADVIVSMLADDVAARAIWQGDQGALVGAAKGSTLIECSTASVSWVRELAAAAKAQGCEFLDAPVTGSKTQAAAGELNFLVGGAEPALARVRPILDAMGRSITLLGPTGSGAMVKLINNFVCGVQAVSLAEALAMIERTGLDREKALGVLVNGAPGSPMVKALSTRMASRDYTPNFLLRLMTKDLAYAIKEGAAAGIELTSAKAAHQAYTRAIEKGEGEKDLAAVIEQYRQR